MGGRISTSIWKTQKQNNKSTSSLPAKEERKIQSRNRCLRTYNRRSTIPRTRQEMETNSIPIEDDATSRKKLLAIVEALIKWRQYLLDTMKLFEVWMNHENLEYFWEPHKLNGQQAWWYLKWQDYNFTLRHIPDKTNTKVDILSRKDQINTKEDNKNI